MRTHADVHPLIPTRHGILRHSSPTLGWVQQALDVALALAVFYLAAAVKLDGRFPEHYQVLAGVIALVMVLVYQWSGVYHALRMASLWLEARGLAKAWLGVFMVLFTLGVATKTNHLFSREALFWWGVGGYSAQIAFHAALRGVLASLRRRGYNLRRAVLVGGGRVAQQFAQRIAANEWMGIHLVGFVGEEPWPQGGGTPALTHLGGFTDLAEVVRRQKIEGVYITLPMSRSSELESTVRALMPLPVSVHWVPDMTSLQLISHSVREIDGQPVLSLSDSPVTGLPRVGKWLEDKLIALAVLVLASPLLAAIALAIWATMGRPILFKQVRAGLNGVPVNVYKFRSMVQHKESGGAVTQATREDPRVTPVGRFLRATSLDELPQFYNVLQGRMSVVGPRPHAIEHDGYYERQIDDYMLRHRIKPGITGWAQVNGYRGETRELQQMAERVKYDVYYINNWSLWFDFVIILMTAWVVLTGRNAY